MNIDSAVGQPYVIYEGLTMDTVLMNRLDGDSVGPVKVLVSNPVYSHDRQHVLVPDGTIVLGEAQKIGSNGFGQQRRIAVIFHRMIMPDGYSVDLDQFHGLDQIGEEGLKDKVNNHYLEIFGTSIALGVIAGAGEIEQGGGAITTSGSQAFTTGLPARFAVCNHRSRPVHANSTNHHNPGGSPGQGLFHPGHASPGVREPHNPQFVLRSSMRHTTGLIALTATLTFMLAGCQSHQAKVDATSEGIRPTQPAISKDCSAEYLKVPPTLSPKCTDESKKLGEAGKRLQAERAKQ